MLMCMGCLTLLNSPLQILSMLSCECIPLCPLLQLPAMHQQRSQFLHHSLRRVSRAMDVCKDVPQVLLFNRPRLRLAGLLRFCSLAHPGCHCIFPPDTMPKCSQHSTMGVMTLHIHAVSAMQRSGLVVSPAGPVLSLQHAVAAFLEALERPRNPGCSVLVACAQPSATEDRFSFTINRI
jgi:hypothetical protein